MRSTIFDVTKSIVLIAVIGLGWYYGNAFFKKHVDEPIVPPTKIEIENAVKLAAITASNSAVEQLRKEFAAERSKILEAYERDRKYTKEALIELGEIKAELKQTRDLVDRKSDVVYKPKDQEKSKDTYEFKKIYTKDAEDKEFPIAWSMFYPNQTPDKFWKTGTYPLEYNVRVLETETPDGKFNRYAEVFAMNNQMKETKGMEFKLKVTDIKWAVVERKEKRFFMFNPRVAFGGIANSDGISTGLNVSTTSYGRTKTDMDWRFFTFGLGAIKDDNGSWHGMASFEPVSFNIGTKLPLINNLFIGLAGTITTDNTTNVGVQVSIPF